ncbi:MAG: replication-relaxation family protein [Acidobacteria bacterium]|nr:replication-relaxation family protein [Acidobacteriota bacterium]
MLRAARWLTTGQIGRRFFSCASKDACRKWLRKLAEAGFLVRFQENRMKESLFALGTEGKRALEKIGANGIGLERRPPRQLEHFTGINDLRIAAELTPGLSFFFACWELPRYGWKYLIIPDAVFSVAGQTFAVEFDRGKESVSFLRKTKVSAYRQGLDGFPLSAVLVVTDGSARMQTLARRISNHGERIWFTTLAQVRTEGFQARIFYRKSESNSPSSFGKLSCQSLLSTGEVLERK